MPQKQNSRSVLDYLGTIGTTDRGDVSLSNSLTALVELGAFLIEEARNNMDKKGNVASGDTADSMRIVGLQQVGTGYELPIEILSTYKFLDKGVKGTKGGKGKYQFKTSRPNKKMAKAILKWLKRRAISATKYKAISTTERKDKRIKRIISEAKSREALSYAMASSIKQKGIKPTYFFTKAIAATRRKAKQDFGNALKLDIIESLNSLN